MTADKPIFSAGVALLLMSQVLSADEGVGLSSQFTTDTRWSVHAGERDSGYFVVDTRFSGSASDALSDLFVVDTASAIIGNATISGRVTDAGGAGLAGATVLALQNSIVRRQVVTDANGYYTLTLLPAGSYELRATKPNYLTGIGYEPNLSSAGSAQANFALANKPAVPALTPVVRPPEACYIGPIGTDQLQVYSGGSFHPYGSIDLGKMTVVFTHGWNSDPDVWATDMVAQMIAGGFNNANFLAWNWSNAAASSFAKINQVGARTPQQGEALGGALTNALGSSYGRPIHFIGHSFGALVNAEAANFLHEETGGAFNSSLTHSTLLDEGEVGFVAGNIVRAFGGSGWVSPIPNSYAWLDNYISLVAPPHRDRGVDAVLGQGFWRVPQALDVVQLAQNLHRYAATWYALSAADPNGSVLGFKNSFEKQGVSWSPAWSAPRRGTVYRQGYVGSELSLVQMLPTHEIQAISDLMAVNGLNLLVVGGLQFGTAAAQVTGNVLLDVAEALIPTSDTHLYPVYSGTANSTVMYYSDFPVDSEAFFSIEVTLPSSDAPGGSFRPGGAGGQPLDPPADTNPPCVWLPISVPSNAALFSFDFSFEGAPGEDLLSASIAGSNVFALEAKYMPTNQLLNSGLIPVDGFAGQDVELFFGLLGGTSSNASVVVNAMRFYSIDPPALSMAVTGSTASIVWPATLAGFALESADGLSPQDNWTPVTNSPSLSGLQNVLTNSVSGSVKFYRLRKP